MYLVYLVYSFTYLTVFFIGRVTETFSPTYDSMTIFLTSIWKKKGVSGFFVANIGTLA